MLGKFTLIMAGFPIGRCSSGLSNSVGRGFTKIGSAESAMGDELPGNLGRDRSRRYTNTALTEDQLYPFGPNEVRRGRREYFYAWCLGLELDLWTPREGKSLLGSVYAAAACRARRSGDRARPLSTQYIQY